MSVQTTSGGSSSSTSSSSDMTLPTPPRSPNASMGFDETMQDTDYDEEEYSASQGIPEPLLDDLLELWCDEADYNVDPEEPDEISFRNALSELGFDSSQINSNAGQSDSMSETEHAENMINQLLQTCKNSYLSPPPTNPSSPKMQADSEFEENYQLSSVKFEMPEKNAEEVEEEVVSGEEECSDSSPEVEGIQVRVKVEDMEEADQVVASMEDDDDDDDIFTNEQQDEVIQNLIDCSEELMNYEIDEHLLAKFDDPLQAMGDTSTSAAKCVEKLMDVLKTESEAVEMSEEVTVAEDNYDLFGEPKMKKGRFDFEDELLNFPDIKQDCMWNGYLGDVNLSPVGASNWLKQEYTFETLFDEKEKLEVSPTPANTAEEKLKAAQKEAEDAAAAEEARKKRKLEDFRIAFDNDHRYALSHEVKYLKDGSAKSKTTSSTQQRKVIQGIIVKSEPQTDKSGGGTTTKKTKILVPLKDLMETLQQKSFLVSPLGPNKKIIRFTGSDSVKGVLSAASFQSAAIVAGQSSSSGRTITTVQSKPNHNVRKRPHPKSPKIEITPALSPDDLDSSSPLSSSLVSPSASSSNSPSSSSNPSSSSTSTKKKTKAHNNMERMRRIDLRNSFDNLKKLVPPLAKIPKCSKVEILRRAEEYIKGLRNQEKRLQKEEMQVRQRNAQLRSRLESTSSSLNNFTSPFSSSIGCN